LGVTVKCCPVSDGVTTTSQTGENSVIVIPAGLAPGTRVHITQIWASNEPSDNLGKDLTIATEGGALIWKEYTETEPFVSRYFHSPLRGPVGEDLTITFEGHPGSVSTLSVTYYISV